MSNNLVGHAIDNDLLSNNPYNAGITTSPQNNRSGSSSDIETSLRTDSITEKTGSSIIRHREQEVISEEGGDELFKRSRGVILIESVKDFIYLDGKKLSRYLVFSAIFLLAWVVGFDKSTTKHYEVFATSDMGHHTMISTVKIANNVISAVGNLFFAKFSDLTSRPVVLLVATFFFVVGYTIIPAGNGITNYIVGNVFGSLGGSTLSTVNVFLIGDLTPMKWRGFGIAALSSPHIVIVWISGVIVDKILATNWKWGYGMFTIIIPCTVIPIALVLIYVQNQAEKEGIVEEKAEKFGVIVNYTSGGWVSRLIKFCIQMDLFGLLILGTSIALLLLPLSLYKNADGEFKNPSMIAMLVVGGVLLGLFIVYEIYLAPYPCLHESNFNRTIIIEIVFNVVYFIASEIRGTYLSSFVWIYKDWNNRDWTYYNSIGVLGKSIFGLCAGLIHRKTHRYKYVQLFGICVELISAGMWVAVKGRNASTALLVMAEVLSSIGGGFAIYSSRTAIQIAVPHQNMAMAISILSLFTSIGRAVGSAVAGAIWSGKMPANLRKFMPSDVSDEDVKKFFGNLKAIRKFDMNSPIRLAAIDAYVATSYYLWVSSLGITFICFIAVFFQKNYYLGDGQNAIDPSEREDSINRDLEPRIIRKIGAKLPYFNKYFQETKEEMKQKKQIDN